MANIKNSKWFSRKLFMALIGVLIVVLNDVLQLGIDPDTIVSMATIIAGYLFGQGIADHGASKPAEPSKPDIMIQG